MSRSSVTEDEEPLMNVTNNSDSSHEGNGNGGPLSWIGMADWLLQYPCLHLLLPWTSKI